jgi:hypothetical protein
LDVFSFQKLHADSGDMRSGIILLEGNCVETDERHHNWYQNLIPISLPVQVSLHEMQWCSLTDAYACLHHDTATSMGHSAHNIDVRKPLTNSSPNTLSAISTIQFES